MCDYLHYPGLRRPDLNYSDLQDRTFLSISAPQTSPKWWPFTSLRLVLPETEASSFYLSQLEEHVLVLYLTRFCPKSTIAWSDQHAQASHCFQDSLLSWSLLFPFLVSAIVHALCVCVRWKAPCLFDSTLISELLTSVSSDSLLCFLPSPWSFFPILLAVLPTLVVSDDPILLFSQQHVTTGTAKTVSFLTRTARSALTYAQYFLVLLTLAKLLHSSFSRVRSRTLFV